MDQPGRIDVSRVMADIRMRASTELRERAFDRGNTPEFADAALFDLVEQILRGAVDDADADRKVLLLSEIIAGNKELTLEPSARLGARTRHRRLERVFDHLRSRDRLAHPRHCAVDLS